MTEFIQDILDKRSSPGLLLFNFQGRLLFFNQKSQEIIKNLESLSTRPIQDNPDWPSNISALFNDLLLASQKKKTQTANKDFFSCSFLGDGFPYALRAFLLGTVSKNNKTPFILMLAEPIIENRIPSPEKLKTKYNLTKREIEVIKLMCGGLTNKDISTLLFVSEHTVKDHIKHIMMKLGVSSKNKILATLFQRPI